jgi:glycolate oxidase iron-sulfur subunit
VSDRPLGLDPDELIACVACGLCLPHCPTYRVTGLELASPRGRIAAMRAVESGAAPLDDTFVEAMEQCVQCRGCEAACPSGVRFGSLMADTRAALTDTRSVAERAPRWRRAAEWFGYRVVLPRHRLLRALSWVLLLGQRLHLVSARLTVPPLDRAALRSRLDAPRGGDPGAWLFTGCVMDAWMRPTHAAALQVLRVAGVDVALPGPGGDCCGALHEHGGRRDDAIRLARRVMSSMPGTAPIVVDSAGCGAALQHYGELLDTPEAHAFSARVRDFAQYVAEVGVPAVRPSGRTVVVQDPCHLRHVQRSHLATRTVLGEAYTLVETDDDGLCCGAGGAYSQLQPALAAQIRNRKVAALQRAGSSEPGTVVCSANPGCAMHLAAAGFAVAHPAELLAAALDDGSSPPATPETA